MNAPLKILLISGSIRVPSHTRTLTEAVAQALREREADAVHWDLSSQPLPIADPEHHRNPASHPDSRVRRLVRAADESDGFVLASPVYHNSYSGVLKNALDHLAIAQFHYKPIALLGHGGHRTTQPVDHLRIVARGLLGVALPTHVCVSQEDFDVLPNGGYKLDSPEIRQRIQRLAIEMTVFALQLRALRQATGG